MIELTADQVAALRQVSRNTVYKAHLPKTSSGQYDLLDPVVRDYVIEPYLKKAVDDIKRADVSDLEEAVYEQLEKEKLKADIIWKKKQSRKLDREHEIKSMNLIYRNDVAIGFGAFISGIKNNFLNIGTRVARGDKKLRDKIEKEISKSIEKTIVQAQDEVRKIIKLELE